MKTIAPKLLIIGLFLIALFTNLNSQCLPEDCASSGETQFLAATVIPAPTIPMLTIDFEAMTAGPTNVADINTSYPEAGISTINTALGTGGAINGVYDVYLGGNALGLNDSGELAILSENSSFIKSDSINIGLISSVTEIGVQIGDWINSPFYINLYSGSTKVGMATIVTSESIQYIQCDVAFDNFTLTAYPDFDNANWVITGLALPPQSAAVPTLSQWGIIILSLIFLIFGVVGIRKRIIITT